MHGAWQFVALVQDTPFPSRCNPGGGQPTGQTQWSAIKSAGAGRFVGRAADSCSSSGAASSGGRASCHGISGSCAGRASGEFRGGGTGLTNGEHRRRGRMWACGHKMLT